MGRRRSRKAERRSHARQSRGGDFASEPTLEELLAIEQEQRDDMELPLAHPFRTLTPAKACGRCREFVEDGDAGRGTCLHPGSGILSPWTDTPGCDFFTDRRR